MKFAPNKPRTPAKTPAHALPDAEIQELAKTAHAAWESGLPMRAPDSQGGMWSFVTIRDTAIRLEVERITSTDDTSTAVLTSVSGLEMGRDDPLPMLASRILSLAAKSTPAPKGTPA